MLIDIPDYLYRYSLVFIIANLPEPRAEYSSTFTNLFLIQVFNQLFIQAHIIIVVLLFSQFH
jgi:hypothetical protein